MSNMVDSINNAISQSLLTRLLANVFLFIVLVSGIIIIGYEIIAGQPINQILYSLVFTGIGYAVHLLGINVGVTLTPSQDGEKQASVEDLPTVHMPAIPNTPPIDTNATPKQIPVVKIP